MKTSKQRVCLSVFFFQKKKILTVPRVAIWEMQLQVAPKLHTIRIRKGRARRGDFLFVGGFYDTNFILLYSIQHILWPWMVDTCGSPLKEKRAFPS